MPDLDAQKPPIERKISPKDFDRAADYIVQEYSRRKRDREDTDHSWSEIDRQLRMVARPSNINPKTGRPHPGTEWRMFFELPWQSQTLEVLTSDMRRLSFPTDRNWFSARADDSPDVLAVVEAEIAEQRLGVSATANQQTISDLVEGVHTHYQDMYRFRDEWDKMCTEGLAFGTFCARGRIVKAEKFSHDYRGVRAKNHRIPAFVYTPIRQTYLDDAPATAMRSGEIVNPGHIFETWQNIHDLRLAATRGSNDTQKPDGGWRAEALKDLDSGTDGNDSVRLLEWEGDIVVPQDQTSALFFPAVIVTVVMGYCDGQALARVVRWRERSLPFGSYLFQHYHQDDPTSVYGTSPLMKGLPIQKGASDAYSRLVQAGILNVEPPISYDDQDPHFAAKGGPRIAPGALWRTATGVNVVLIGDLSAIAGVFELHKREYQDVTGTAAPRLGQQTKSHQTAFAIDSEIQRSAVRTVDVARSWQYGTLRTWLSMEYEMIRTILREDGPQHVFVPKWGTWIEVTADMLPERVTYDVHGVTGPLEEQEDWSKKQNVLAQFFQAEQMAVQLGHPPSDWNEIRRVILREGFTDIEPFVGSSTSGPGGVPGDAAATAGVPQAIEGSPEDNLIRVAAGVRAPVAATG